MNVDPDTTEMEELERREAAKSAGYPPEDDDGEDGDGGLVEVE